MEPNIHLRIVKMPYGNYILTRLQYLQSKIGAPIVIQGSYNTGNIGDLAIGATIQNELKKIGLYSHLNGSINLWRGCAPSFKKYDYHIIGGGGVIRDYPQGYLEPRLKPIGTAKKGSMLMSVGFNGLRTENGKKIIKKLEDCKSITVRDEKSKKNLQLFIDKNIEVVACPAFLLKSKKTCGIITDRNVVGLNLNNFYKNIYRWGDYAYFPRKIDLEIRRKQYINYLNKTLKPNLMEITKENQIVFIPFTQDDIIFAKEHFKEIPMQFLPLQPPLETLAAIEKVDRMICMRYHSLIFSIIAKKPVFVISYQNKTRELLKKLKGVTFVDFLEPEPIEVDFTISINQLSKIKYEMINSAKKNFEKFESLIMQEEN